MRESDNRREPRSVQRQMANREAQLRERASNQQLPYFRPRVSRQLSVARRRQPQGETRSPARCAFDRNIAAHHLAEFLADG